MSYHVIQKASEIIFIEHTCQKCWEVIYMLDNDIDLSKKFSIDCRGCGHKNIYEPLLKNGMIVQ